MEEGWSRILDSDNWTAEQLAKELTAERLDFVRDEGGALDAAVRAKVLMSLIYLKDEQLESLNDSIEKLCEACETDAEDWMRVLSGIVLRWLKKVPKDRQDAYFSSLKTICENLCKAQKPSIDNGKFWLPVDVLPTHWPFLAPGALPTNFDVEESVKNQHFSLKAKSEKRIKILSPSSPSTTEGNSSAKPRKFPEKIENLLKDAHLVSTADLEVIQHFFETPITELSTKETLIALSDIKSAAENKPGKIQVDRVSLKLIVTRDDETGKQKKQWNIIKNRRFENGSL